MDRISRDALLHRRQYLYGPDYEDFPQWNRVRMVNGNLLAVHPDLELTQARFGEVSLTLLGYILDPTEPDFDNSAILRSLWEKSQDFQHLLSNMDHYGGRFVLFVFWGNDQVVLSDGTGLRQVFYFTDSSGKIWLSAQPGLISEKFNLVYSPQAKEFLASETIQKYGETWWPGDSTPFENIKHLQANYFLCLDSGKRERFWPRKRIKKYGVKKGAKKASELLRGLMTAANNRFDLAMALTGGYDSRIVFAAAREICSDMYIFTMIYRKLTEDSSDITIADQLAKYSGNPHHIIACDKPMDVDFIDLYSQNIEKVYQLYPEIVYGRFKNLDQRKVVVKSVVNEIVRCFYYRTGVHPYETTVDFLCQISKLGKDPFVYRHFDAWLTDALPAEKLGYKILDLFYWENRNSNWQGMSQLEFDIAQDEFTPFSNRELLNIMLGVNHKYRCMPKNRFQREMVRAGWPEVDNFPYNPGAKFIKKPWYEGPWMVVGRWIKYRILRKLI